MKKIPILLTGFLLLTLLLHAQEKPSNYFVELSAGPSFPIGKFGEQSYKGIVEDNEPAGLARMGLNLQAAVGFHINESFGVLLMPGYSIHKQDKSGYEEFIRQSVTSQGGPPPDMVDVNTQRWKILKLMAGGFLVTPLTFKEDLVLQTKLVAGACKTAVPGYSYTYISQGGMERVRASAGKTGLNWAFCYQVSLGIKYKLNDKLHVLLDVNSFNATAKKEYTFTIPPFPNPVPSRTENVKYRLAEVNLMAGIGVSF